MNDEVAGVVVPQVRRELAQVEHPDPIGSQVGHEEPVALMVDDGLVRVRPLRRGGTVPLRWIWTEAPSTPNRWVNPLVRSMFRAGGA